MNTQVTRWSNDFSAVFADVTRAVRLETDEVSNKSAGVAERQPKVSMKIDVLWSHHSIIIGKEGSGIRPIVRKTGVSIHFPDGNKTKHGRKSNQVTINDRGQGFLALEEARVQIRRRIPQIYRFDFPRRIIVTLVEPIVAMEFLEKNSNNMVQVELSLTEDHSVVGIVRGYEVNLVKSTIEKLKKLYCGDFLLNIPVEISAQKIEFVFGEESENMNEIMKTASTIIKMNESEHSWKISGSFDDVTSVKEHLHGLLPLTLSFDLKFAPNLREMECICVQYNVSVTVQDKKSFGLHNVVVYGEEKNAVNIYESCKKIMNVAPATCSPIDISELLSEMPDRRAPGCEKKRLDEERRRRNRNLK